MASCDSAVDSRGAFQPVPDALPRPDESVDVGEGEASFPLHLDTCLLPLRPRPPLQPRRCAFLPEPAGVAAVAAEVYVLAEPECTVPDAYVAFAGAGVHPSSFPPWREDIRFPPQQLLPSLRGLSASRTSQIGPVVPMKSLHCSPVSFHCIDLERSIIRKYYYAYVYKTSQNEENYLRATIICRYKF